MLEFVVYVWMCRISNLRSYKIYFYFGYYTVFFNLQLFFFTIFIVFLGSNHFILSIPDKGYSRNVLCALN
jgi:hypothetical protein